MISLEQETKEKNGFFIHGILVSEGTDLGTNAIWGSECSGTSVPIM